MITSSQDPSLPFSLDTVTVPHYAGMDVPFAPAILLAWTVPLAAVVVFSLVAYFADDPESKRARRATTAVPIAAWLAGMFIIGPVLVSQFIGADGPHQDDAFPNVIGYIKTTKGDPASEFMAWARDRYGLELTAAQAVILDERKSAYGTGQENVSDVVLLRDREVHSYFDGHTIRLMGGPTELDVKSMAR